MRFSHRNSQCLLIITQHVAPAEIKAIHGASYSSDSLMSQSGPHAPGNPTEGAAGEHPGSVGCSVNLFVFVAMMT